MRTLTLFSLLCAAIVFGAAPAEAQRGHSPAGHLVQAVNAFAQQAARVRGGGIGQAVHRFQRTLRTQPNNLQVIAQRYGDLRARLHAAVINDILLLDTWDEVVHAYHEYAESGANNAYQPPHQPPVVVAPPGQGHHGVFTFSGVFENSRVNFTGSSPDDVYQRCTQFMAHARITQVDDIAVNGQRFRNGPSYWQNDALCSIAALNSTPAHTVAVRGNAEGTPFGVAAGMDHVLQTYLPRALASMQVDDIVVNGHAYHNQYGYWSGNEVTAMVLSQGSVPTQPRRRRRRAR